LVPRARLVSAHLCGARYQAKWRGHFGLIVFMLPGSSWEVVISACRSKVTCNAYHLSVGAVLA
jgi:hypothetical protein